MQLLRQLLRVMLFFSLITSSIQAQEPPTVNECQDCGSAYVESYQAAHWSAYVPITIFVAAAIFFGVVDRKNRHHHSCSSSYSSKSSHGHYSCSSYKNGTYSECY